MNKIYVVSINNQYNEEIAGGAFSNEEKASTWLHRYIKDNWGKHISKPIPEKYDDALYEYFFGGEYHINENLSTNEYVLDEGFALELK